MMVFCLFVVAWPSRVGMKVDVGVLVIQSLTRHMVLLLTLLTQFLHVSVLACVESMIRRLLDSTDSDVFQSDIFHGLFEVLRRVLPRSCLLIDLSYYR